MIRAYLPFVAAGLALAAALWSEHKPSAQPQEKPSACAAQVPASDCLLA